MKRLRRMITGVAGRLRARRGHVAPAPEQGRELREIQGRLDSHAVRFEDFDRALTDLQDVHNRAERELEIHLAQHRTTAFMTEEWDTWVDAVAGRVEGFRGRPDGEEEYPYRAFEQRFRGSRERVMELQRPYVEMLRGRDPVFDFGCGRGELLQLLTEAGIPCSGVDQDAGMLNEARDVRLNVACGDALTALASQRGSFGAVTAMQVIEHLPYGLLRGFFHAARLSLRASGRLIVETVNPHSVVGLKAFWLDPTHQHPLFPETAAWSCVAKRAFRVRLCRSTVSRAMSSGTASFRLRTLSSQTSALGPRSAYECRPGYSSSAMIGAIRLNTHSPIAKTPSAIPAGTSRNSTEPAAAAALW